MPSDTHMAETSLAGTNANTSAFESGYVLGVDLGGTKTLIMASTLGRTVIAKRKWMTPNDEGPLKITWLVSIIKEFIAAADLPLGHLKAAAMGIPGLVDIETGQVSLAPNLGWTDRYGYAIRQPIEEDLGIPVAIDNDVNMAAIGEKAFGIAKDVRNFVFVAMGTGIGMGIVINGEIYRGAHWSAGEIGYMALDESCLNHVYTDHGYLELMASGGGIAQRACDILRTTGDLRDSASVDENNRLRKKCQLDAKGVFLAAAKGNRAAMEVVEKALNSLALALVNIIAILDPELIILGGGMLKDPRILQILSDIVPRLIHTKTKLVMSKLGMEAQAYGAIAVALDLAAGK